MKKGYLYEMWAVHEEILSSQDALILELKDRVHILEETVLKLERLINEHKHRPAEQIRYGR